MFCKTLAPVVVKPETDSKNASLKCGTNPDSMNGTAPNKPAPSHAALTKRIPSRTVSRIGCRFVLINKRIVITHNTAIGIKNAGSIFHSCKNTATATGIKKLPATIERIIKMMVKHWRNFIFYRRNI